MTQVKVVEASRSKIISKTNFTNYDWCLNPYVGCEFGCTYCYVRFFIKDKDADWGEFVRLRNHIATKLPAELDKIGGSRVVLGTMTDPFQPQETKAHLTRTALEIIAAHPNPPERVGIFTRSPIVTREMELLQKIGVRIHFTVTPYEPDVLRKIEPKSPPTKARWKAVRALKAAGLWVAVNVSPVVPIYSEPLTGQFAEELASIQPDEFYVDPVQPYKEAMAAMESALADEPRWPEVKNLLRSPASYKAWKDTYGEDWRKAWAPHAGLPSLPILMDHVRHLQVNMATGESLDWKSY